MRVLTFVGIVFCLALLLVTGGAAVAQQPLTSGASGCDSGASYDPACDVNRDSSINIEDLQLVAARWGQDGTWTTDGWSLTGNPSTNPDTHFLGTTDNVAFEMRVNDQRALRIEPQGTSPNWIAGYSGNSVSDGVVGAVIGGGGQAGAINQVTADFGTITGGLLNIASESRTTVSGGVGNRASGRYATVAGGILNTASITRTTVGGGEGNEASGDAATVAGGDHNAAEDSYATVGGGLLNTASGFAATIGGGHDNEASGNFATVGGGINNSADGEDATVSGGHNNVASGKRATVPGGHENIAAGDYTFAAGRRAKADHDGAFVWGDSTDADIYSGGDDQFIVRANGGIWLGTVTTTAPFTPTINPGVFINTSTGAYLSSDGVWTNASDRNAKTNFTPVDGQEVLARLSEVAITFWSYKGQDPSVRHIGPMAQDFFTAFGVGYDEQHISTVDADGVALAAIQGLYRVVQEKEAQVAAQQEQINALRQQNADLEARLAALERTVGTRGQGEGERPDIRVGKGG